MASRTPAELFELGKMQLAQGNREHARSLFRQALEEGELCLAPREKSAVLIALGKVDRDLGFPEDARVHYQMAAEIIRTLDEPLRFAHALRHVGDILREQQKLSEAEPFYAESLAIYRARPETPSLDLANALRGYALLKAAVGEATEAAGLWHEAGTLYESVGVEAGVSESRRQLALLTTAD